MAWSSSRPARRWRRTAHDAVSSASRAASAASRTPIQPARGQRPEHAFRGVLDRQRTCTDLLAQAGVVDEVRADPEVAQRQHVVGVGQTDRKPGTDIVHR